MGYKYVETHEYFFSKGIWIYKRMYKSKDKFQNESSVFIKEIIIYEIKKWVWSDN